MRCELMDCAGHKLWSYSLPVVHAVRCNVRWPSIVVLITHRLFVVMGDQVIFSNEKQIHPHSLPVCDMKRSDWHRSHVTHWLFIIGWEAMKLLGIKTYNLWSWDDEVTAKKYSSVTHILLVMGWDINDETAWEGNHAVSLTCCWSWDEM